MKRPTLSILAVLGASACGLDPAVPGPTNQGHEPLNQAQLDQLNIELQSLTLQQAMDRLPHFRPICDEQGYPLVGNLTGKVATTAGQFCEAVREVEHK